MQGSKIRLSVAEHELFCNAEMILTKNSILQKTVSLLGEVQDALIHEKEEKNYAVSSSPKISRGENYLGLPYVILDFPRVAEGQNLFFIRSMFWWGNFFSSTLQLSGVYKEQQQQKLTEAYETLKESGYYVGIDPDPWIHHFEATNYQKISGLSASSFSFLMQDMSHTKIARHWSLGEWDSAYENLIRSWKLLMGLIS